jgi:hypothetical protein
VASDIIVRRKVTSSRFGSEDRRLFTDAACSVSNVTEARRMLRDEAGCRRSKVLKVRRYPNQSSLRDSVFLACGVQ